jgi:hypothetical protein
MLETTNPVEEGVILAAINYFPKKDPDEFFSFQTIK